MKRDEGRSSGDSHKELLPTEGGTLIHLNRKSAAVRPLMLDRIIHPRPLKKHPFLFWISVGILLACASTYFSLKTTNPKAYTEMCVLQIIGLVTVPLIIRACHKMILDWSRNATRFITRTRLPVANIDAWLDREISIFEGSPLMLCGGFAFAIIAPIGFSFADYPVGFGSAQNAFASSIVAISAFVAGVGLCAMAYGTRMIWRFGTSFQISVQDHKFGVLSTGDMLSHCCILVALAWSAYTSSAIFGVMGHDFVAFSLKNPIWLLAAPSAAIVLISFIVCQVPLHVRMIEYKRDQLMEIEKILEELKSADAKTLTAEALSKIEFFENRRLQIMSLPEWPFAFGTLMGSISSASMVILTALLSSYVKAAWALP